MSMQQTKDVVVSQAGRPVLAINWYGQGNSSGEERMAKPSSISFPRTLLCLLSSHDYLCKPTHVAIVPSFFHADISTGPPTWPQWVDASFFGLSTVITKCTLLTLGTIHNSISLQLHESESKKDFYEDWALVPFFGIICLAVQWSLAENFNLLFHQIPKHQSQLQYKECLTFSEIYNQDQPPPPPTTGDRAVE